MSDELITGLVVGVLGLLGAVAQARRRRPSLRDEIRSDLEIYSMLPESSPGRVRLLQSIESHLERLTNYESVKRRDPAGAALGVLLVLAFGWLTWAAWTAGGWWLVLTVPTSLLVLVGLYGAVHESIPMKRNVKGNPID